ncbi:unnamed protein product [Sympodiomycopsis kandeliae]
MAVEELDVVALSFGLFVCLYGVFSFHIKERLYIGEAPLAFLLGILLGPYGIGQLTKWDGQGEDSENAAHLALGLSRIVIGVQLVLVGIQLPKSYLIHEARSLTMILLPVMSLMWVITAFLIKFVFPDVSILVALILSACTTPTDPVLSNSIVKGAFADQFVPARLRNLISAESGLNDGLALPYLFLAIRLLRTSSTSEALTTWILKDILWTVMGSAAVGIVIGLLANRALRFACKHNTIDKESFLLYGPVLGLATLGLAGAIGVDDLLAVFVAGNAFTYDDWYREETESDEVQNVLDFLLNSMFFAFAGAALPFATFNDPEVLGTTPAKLLLLSVLVLLFRRIPPMLALYKVIPALGDYAEASFVGYFGPIGAGAIFYASLILQEFPEELETNPQPETADSLRVRQLVRPVCYSLVIASLIGHTLAIPFVKVAFDWRGTGSIQLKETQEAQASQETAQDSEEERYESGEGQAPEDAEGQQAGMIKDPSSQAGAPNDDDGMGYPEDEEARGPPSSAHRAERSRSVQRQHSRDSGSSIRLRRRDVDAAYRQGLQSSWRQSSGHKLGPHIAFELEHGQGGPTPSHNRVGLRGQRRNSAGFGQMWTSVGRPQSGFGDSQRWSTGRDLEAGQGNSGPQSDAGAHSEGGRQ